MKIIFIGTPNFGAIVLEKLLKNKMEPVLVVTKPDKPIGRKKVITPPPVKILAKKYKIPFLQPDKIENIQRELEKINPDLILVAAYGKIIPKKILQIPKHGCLNVHPSLLPKHRGASPLQFTVLNGDKETGVTLILMTEKMDEGPILDQLKIKIENQKIFPEELEKKLAELGADLAVKIIPKWIKNKIKPQKQNEKEATYTKIIKKEDGKIDWSKPAEYLEKQIRAFHPWPGSFCKIDDKIMKVLKASALEQTKVGPQGPIGKTYLATNEQIAVQCKKDYLIIEELQFEGKKKMTAKDFLKGNMNFIGKILK
ncbi:MAG: methionyl-tRNA formyltransferase [Candidatus Nealsonbacteria bacterium]|nr:methionyl-tRNA formyltransferase [Candidatus Nealsonbacteria bacterium]